MGARPAINPLHVDKKTVLVHLVLIDGLQIMGYIHLGPRIRLTDVLNYQAEDKPFLPITNAQLITHKGEKKAVPFIIINRNNIMSCIPQQPDKK